MNRILLCFAFSAFSALGTGCNHDKTTEASPAASATAVVTAPAVAPAVPSAAVVPVPVPVAAVNVEQIPTEEDFEDKATTTITPANASAQLAALEKEMGK